MRERTVAGESIEVLQAAIVKFTHRTVLEAEVLARGSGHPASPVLGRINYGSRGGSARAPDGSGGLRRP